MTNDIVQGDDEFAEPLAAVGVARQGHGNVGVAVVLDNSAVCEV